MARTVDAKRLAAAGQIMIMLRQSPLFRETVAAHESGERPILVALPDDPLEEVIDRIHAIGLPVTLVVPGESENPTVITVHAREPEQGVIWEEATPGATIGLVVSHFHKEPLAPLSVPDPPKHGLVLELVNLR
jgi:hypothetical protein